MKMTVITLKVSKAKILLVLLIFMFSIFVVVYLLHAWLFYLGLLLWVLAVTGGLINFVSVKKIDCIHVIDTAHARQINILYDKKWLNHVSIKRYILIAGAIYVKLNKVGHNKQIKLWLFRDNFISLEDRYQLIKVLRLAKGELDK